jgi:type I restriction enzyme M protein
MDASQIGKRAWNYAGVLRDAGLSSFEYVEQLTLLLFLKMADQLTEEPYNRAPIVPPELGWKALLPLDGAALEGQYRTSLEKLGVKPGMLGVIFKGARSEIHNPALLKQIIVNLIDKEDWLSLPVDVKGTIYEELLARSAQESARGAGQYFTTRPVIEAICEAMQPTPADTICDPAAGTGGFLCTAYNYVLGRHESDLDGDEKRALQERLVKGMELSTKVGRMCAMNLYLHNIGNEQAVVIHTGHDSLAAPWKREYSMVLTNPPFGKKQSLLFVNEEGDTEKEDQIVVREDFWTSTSNKQLNFVQHIYSLLKIDGRAAVVVPDNVLFEGGAGREGAAQSLAEMPRAYTLTPADRHLVFAGRQSERALLREEGRPRRGLDRQAMGLRSAHEPAFHAEAEADPAQRLRRVHRLLQAGPHARAQRDLERSEPGRALALLRVRRASQARQAQPRSVLDQGQEPDRHRRPAAARDHRRGNRG